MLCFVLLSLSCSLVVMSLYTYTLIDAHRCYPFGLQSLSLSHITCTVSSFWYITRTGDTATGIHAHGCLGPKPGVLFLLSTLLPSTFRYYLVFFWFRLYAFTASRTGFLMSVRFWFFFLLSILALLSSILSFAFYLPVCLQFSYSPLLSVCHQLTAEVCIFSTHPWFSYSFFTSIRALYSSHYNFLPFEAYVMSFDPLFYYLLFLLMR